MYRSLHSLANYVHITNWHSAQLNSVSLAYAHLVVQSVSTVMMMQLQTSGDKVVYGSLNYVIAVVGKVVTDSEFCNVTLFLL